MSSAIKQLGGAGDDRLEISPDDVNGESNTPAVAPLGNQVPTPPGVTHQADPPRVGLAGESSQRDIEGGPDGGENEALEEIDNLLWIKNQPNTEKNRCQEALRSWTVKDRLFTSRIDRKRKQSADFQNEVYQLVGFYSVFLGVLLTAVAQSNLLHCNNTWTATLLSSLASFVTIIGVILKLRSIKELENTIASEESTRRVLVDWLWNLRVQGQNFNFNIVKAKNQQDDPKKNRRDERSAQWLQGSFLAVVTALILFSVAFVVSIRQILCNPGRNPYP